MLNCFPHDAFPIYLGVFLRQFLGLLVGDHLQAVFEPPQEGIGLRHLARRLGLDLAMLRAAPQRIRDPPRAEVRPSTAPDELLRPGEELYFADAAAAESDVVAVARDLGAAPTGGDLSLARMDVLQRGNIEVLDR